MCPTIFGTISAYDFFNMVGAITGIIVFILVLYGRTKDYRQVMIHLAINIVIITMGAKGAEILRGLNTLEFSSIKELLLEENGSHFLGRVLFTAWVYPLAYKVAAIVSVKNMKLDYESAQEAVSFYFVIQQMFNRIACFCNGCCYGRRYTGMGAVSMPGVGMVYPVQLVEAMGMLLILILLGNRKKKKKPLFGFMLVLFGGVIFVCEYMMDQTGIVLIAGLSVIQYAAVLCMLTGWFYMHKKRETHGRRSER